MSSFLLIVLLLTARLLLLTPTLAQPRVVRRHRRCGEFCSFRLCDFNGTANGFHTRPVASFVGFNLPRLATYPYICRVGLEETMDLVDQVGEARVFDQDAKQFIPISLWRPQGLSNPFPRDFIGAFATNLYRSGITMSRRPVGNQWSYLHDRCMILPIHQYRVRTEVGIDTNRTTGEQNSCVAFRITAPELRFKLQWDSRDDMDLVVEEPDGDAITHYNKTYSESGRLIHDNNRGLCLTRLGDGVEDVVYFPGYGRQAGPYKVYVKMTTKCGREPTTWRLLVIQNGELHGMLSGEVSRGPGTPSYEASHVFTII